MAPPELAAACAGSIPHPTTPGPFDSATGTGATSQVLGRIAHGNEDTIKLIECVKARPALWHRKHLRQRVQVAHRGWEEIRKVFQTDDVTSLKVRWKTLRDSFRREVKRIEDGELTTSNWPLFDRMTFLVGHFRTRESYYMGDSSSPDQGAAGARSREEWSYEGKCTSSSFYSEDTNQESIADGGGSGAQSIDEDHVMHSTTGPRPAAESDSVDLSAIEAYVNRHTVANVDCELVDLPPAHLYREVTFKNRLRARIKDEPEDIPPASTSGLGEAKHPNPYESDSDYAFLMSLYPFFKSLPAGKNLFLRIKIQQMIFDATHKDSALDHIH